MAACALLAGCGARRLGWRTGVGTDTIVVCHEGLVRAPLGPTCSDLLCMTVRLPRHKSRRAGDSCVRRGGFEELSKQRAVGRIQEECLVFCVRVASRPCPTRDCVSSSEKIAAMMNAPICFGPAPMGSTILRNPLEVQTGTQRTALVPATVSNFCLVSLEWGNLQRADLRVCA